MWKRQPTVAGKCQRSDVIHRLTMGLLLSASSPTCPYTEKPPMTAQRGTGPDWLQEKGICSDFCFAGLDGLVVECDCQLIWS